MAIKDLLAVVDTGAKDEQFLRDAIAFAEFHGASLGFVVLADLSAESYGIEAGITYSFLDDFTRGVEAKQQRIADLARSASVNVRTIPDEVAVVFAKTAVYARYADLVLFGPAEAYAQPVVRRETIESVLFGTGRPLLVLPHGHVPQPLSHVALGWNASREATRALRDAAWLAEPGAKTDVIVLDGKPSLQGHGAEPGADIARHLSRHGFEAEVVAISAGERRHSEALLRAAQERGAQMLALGAYGHSRLRQMILGGVTRDLLDGSTPMPLLFSH